MWVLPQYPQKQKVTFTPFPLTHTLPYLSTVYVRKYVFYSTCHVTWWQKTMGDQKEVRVLISKSIASKQWSYNFLHIKGNFIKTNITIFEHHRHWNKLSGSLKFLCWTDFFSRTEIKTSQWLKTWIIFFKLELFFKSLIKEHLSAQQMKSQQKYWSDNFYITL